MDTTLQYALKVAKSIVKYRGECPVPKHQKLAMAQAYLDLIERLNQCRDETAREIIKGVLE